MKFLLNFIWLPIISVIRFDRQFYNNTYSEIEGNILGIMHLIRKGLSAGYLPCEGVDPILFKLNPAKYCKKFSMGFANCDYSLLTIFIGPLEPYRLKSGRYKTEKLEYYRELCVPQWISEIKTTTSLGDRHSARELEYLQFSELEAAVTNSSSFALVRIPHGFWDTLFLRESIVDRLCATEFFDRLSRKELKKLVSRYLREKLNNNGVFAESFIETVLNDVAKCSNDPAFHLSLSLKGFPTYSDSPFPDYGDQTEIEQISSLLLSSLKESNYIQPIYDATIVKKWLITGELLRLPNILADKDVVLIGPGFLEDLGEKWNINSYTHVKIPSSNTQEIRYRVLEEIESNCKKSDMGKVFLFQCGASLAFWFISRLYAKFPQNVYIDVGQAISAWYPEVMMKMESRRPNWYLVYKDHIDKIISELEFSSGGV